MEIKNRTDYIFFGPIPLLPSSHARLAAPGVADLGSSEPCCREDDDSGQGSHVDCITGSYHFKLVIVAPEEVARVIHNATPHVHPMLG